MDKYKFSKSASRKAEFMMMFTLDLYESYTNDNDEDLERIRKKWGVDFDEDVNAYAAFNPMNHHLDLFNILSNMILMQTGINISADELAS